jgi:hypothetical protein
MSVVGLLINILGEVLGNIDFSGDPIHDWRRTYCSVNVGVPEVDDEDDFSHNCDNSKKVRELNLSKKAVAKAKCDEIRNRLEAIESKFYEDVSKKFDEKNKNVLENEYDQKNKELEAQYEQILGQLEEEYNKGFAENEDKFFKAEDTKIEKEKSKKAEFDAAVVKNVENRMAIEKSRKQPKGCTSSQQSEAKIRHEAYQEEQRKREKKEEDIAKDEEPVEKTGGNKKTRADIVKRIMKEKGLKMIEASKYVKQYKLY